MSKLAKIDWCTECRDSDIYRLAYCKHPKIGSRQILVPGKSGHGSVRGIKVPIPSWCPCEDAPEEEGMTDKLYPSEKKMKKSNKNKRYKAHVRGIIKEKIMPIQLEKSGELLAREIIGQDRVSAENHLVEFGASAYGAAAAVAMHIGAQSGLVTGTIHDITYSIETNC